MALPWILGAAAVAIAAKVLSSSNDDDDYYERDNSEEVRREAERKRKLAEREALQKNLVVDFNEQCEGAKSALAESLSPYYSLIFQKVRNIEEVSECLVEQPENVSSDMGEWDETFNNLAWLKQVYVVEVKQNTKLTNVFQNIENSEQQFQVAKQLQQHIWQTMAKYQ